MTGVSILFEKTFAKCKTMRYNHFRVGAWCSGSTWASDSHGVGSIPIAPANALHPREKRGCIFMPARLGLPKRGPGIKITPRKRCKALNPPKGADGSPRRGYYYGSCLSICVFCLFTPHHFTARLGLPKRGRGIKITPRKRCKALNPRKEPTEAPAGGITMAPVLNRVFAFCSPTVSPPAAGVD